MPADPVEERMKALRGHWAAMAEENRARVAEEALLHEEMWAGIEVGDVVELTVEEHVRRGGMLLVDGDGEVIVKQGEVMEIRGEEACVSVIEQWGQAGMDWIETREWVRRERIGSVVKRGLKGVEKGVEGVKYWEVE
jgi:hypothetical protein